MSNSKLHRKYRPPKYHITFYIQRKCSGEEFVKIRLSKPSFIEVYTWSMTAFFFCLEPASTSFSFPLSLWLSTRMFNTCPSQLRIYTISETFTCNLVENAFLKLCVWLILRFVWFSLMVVLIKKLWTVILLIGER